jgi:hypothetical protein
VPVLKGKNAIRDLPVATIRTKHSAVEVSSKSRLAALVAKITSPMEVVVRVFPNREIPAMKAGIRSGIGKSIHVNITYMFRCYGVVNKVVQEFEGVVGRYIFYGRYSVFYICIFAHSHMQNQSHHYISPVPPQLPLNIVEYCSK